MLVRVGGWVGSCVFIWLLCVDLAGLAVVCLIWLLCTLLFLALVLLVSDLVVLVNSVVLIVSLWCCVLLL